MKSHSDVFIALTVFVCYGLALIAQDIYLLSINKQVMFSYSTSPAMPKKNMALRPASTVILKLDPQKSADTIKQLYAKILDRPLTGLFGSDVHVPSPDILDSAKILHP
jgi:hypothetical protein